MSRKYYAVRRGKNPGIYDTWDACKVEVHGFKGAEYKSFKVLEEAQNYMENISEIVGIKEDHELTDKEIIAYVDGSYRQSDDSFSYGVWLKGNDIDEEWSARFKDPEMSSMRNVAGEIKGAEVAIKRAIELGFKKIYLHYDYAGIEYWATGEWKRNRRGTQEYFDTVQSLKDKIDIEFIKVDAHTGIDGNERADQLAKDAEFKE